MAKSNKKRKRKPKALAAVKTVPEMFVNRELSWLEFNHRVLGEGCSATVPLMERLKFLAIVSSNLDEFFMIRIAGLMQQRAAGVRKRDLAGMTPRQQITAVSRRVHRMVAEQSEAIHSALDELAGHGVAVLDPQQWTLPQRRFLTRHFESQILPVLTPLAIEDLTPSPLLPGLQLNVALLVDSPDERDGRLVVLPAPPTLPRLIPIPPDEAPDDRTYLARLEDVIAAGATQVAEGRRVLATAIFRITRDADVAIADDDAGDLLQAVEQAVLSRRKRAPVRLEIAAGSHRRILTSLTGQLGVDAADVYEVEGMLDATALMSLAGRAGLDHLRDRDWPPQPPRDLAGSDDLYASLRDHDVLLQHPYEGFDAVVQMVEQAADDPAALAIKQTLYRTSGDSPIIAALERAARSGKQVTVLVELKARFDEARNVQWARRLEDAGCHVIYGIAGLKTHAKVLLVVRREQSRLRRYVHFATGNYNDRTAALYSDVGLMTADADLTRDAAEFFNLLTGVSEAAAFARLTIAPTDLRRRFIELIEREAAVATPDQPGLIMVKVNSLYDRKICEALYAASRAGVKIMLNIRGICCLRPGLKGVSKNIVVHSIVDRFLEHARIFYFRNAGHEEVYISSADWMTRNLDKRLETMVPVREAALRRRLIGVMETYFADTAKAWVMTSDGRYERAEPAEPLIRAQKTLYEEAVSAAEAAARTPQRFRALRRPKKAK